MTPPEITRLEMDAAIAKELATAATARASIAGLEHQRSLLGPYPNFTAPPAPPENRSSGIGWVVAAIVAMFIAWAAVTDGQHSHYDYFGSSHYGR